MATPVTLTVFRGTELLRTETFTREIIKIGRLATAHLSLEDDRISRIHAVVEVSPEGAVSIIDMGSAEGTFVNGKKVSRSALKPGDQVGLGGLRIVVSGAAAQVAAPAPAEVPAAAPVAPPAPEPAPAPAPASAPTSARPAAPRAATAAAARPTAPAPSPAPAAEAAPVAPGPASARAAPPRAAPPAARPRFPRHPHKPRWSLKRARPAAEDLSQGDVGVELRLLWGDTLMDAGAFVAPKAPVLVGEGPGCALRVPASLLPSAAFAVLRFDDGDYRFAFARGMTGAVEDRGARTPLSELVKAGKATPDATEQGTYWVSVPRAGAVRAELGAGLAIEARPRRPQPLDVAPWWERINYQFLNLFLILFFLQAGFVVASSNFPYETDVVADDLFKNPSRMAKFIIKPPEAPKPAEKLPGDKGVKKDEQAGEMAEKHKGEEGQMGKKDAPKTTGRSAPKAIDPNAKEVVKRMGVLGALGRGGGGGLATVFGSGGLGGDIRGATGNMFGATVGDSFGFGGLGVRGTGSGGGGVGETVGIGGIGTKGRGGGLGGYGQGVGSLGRKSDRDISINTGAATVIGSIDKELIRQVIREHAAQIRFCYEEQLAVSPKLAGKVAVKWTIDADGNASNATIVEGTTLTDPKVHQCMMDRIVTWQFPKPKGGGIAVVTYPWILRAAGAE